MAFYRIFPSKDTWISNRIINNVPSTRATGSNHGASPVLNLFALKDSVGSSGVEWARSLVQFNITELSGKIFEERTIPSASVSYYLKMFHYPLAETCPTSYDLFVFPLSRSWDEGRGLDNENFRDFGYANWMSASNGIGWTTTGSDFLPANYGSGSQHFDLGDEDLEVDVTSLVNNWLTASIGQAGGIPNNGVLVKLGTTEENDTNDYYVKAFYGKDSIYVDKIPYIEARWNDSIKDNRGNFAFNQDSKLFLYNVVRGELTNLTQPVLVRIQDHLIGASASYSATVTASFVETGVYSASFNIVNTASFSSSWYDIWHSGAFSYMTGTFTPLVLTGTQADDYSEFVVNVANLKRVYDAKEEARLIVNVRKATKHVTHVVHTASHLVDREYIEKMYYSIINDESGELIVPFGTGTLEWTKLSYNGEGNYFNMRMNAFVPGFTYRVLFLIDVNKYDKKVIDDGFVFKVV